MNPDDESRRPWDILQVLEDELNDGTLPGKRKGDPASNKTGRVENAQPLFRNYTDKTSQQMSQMGKRSDADDVEVADDPARRIIDSGGHMYKPQNSALKIWCSNYTSELKYSWWARLKLLGTLLVLGIVLLLFIGWIVDHRHLNALAEYATHLTGYGRTPASGTPDPGPNNQTRSAS